MAVTVTIWHNPRCSKSRQTLALLNDNGVSPTIRLYLEDAPSRSEICDALNLLGIEPIDLVRRGEATFRDAGLTKDSDPEALIDAMSQYAILIERPIVFANGRAALGRPPESVLEIL